MPPASQYQIPDTAAAQLSTALNWLAVVSRRRLSDDIIRSAMAHHRINKTEPGILIAAAVQYLASRSDREPDQLNRFWHIADQVSARERARYLHLDEKDLR